MTRDEVKVILGKITTYYPNFKISDATQMVDSWLEMLGDLDFNATYIALKAYVQEGNEFAPSIGALRKRVNTFGKPAELEWPEAWALIKEAIKCGTYHSRESFNSFPEALQKAIGSAEWLHDAAVDENFNWSVEESNIRRNYETVMKRKEDMSCYSPDLKTLLENTGACLTLEAKRKNLLINEIKQMSNLLLEEK